MSAHNGLNNIGKIEIWKIPNQIIKAYKDFFLFKWFGINENIIVRILIISSFLLSMLLTIKIFLSNKIEFSSKLLFALALVLFPLAINLIYLFSTDENYLVQIQSCYSLSFLFVYIIYILEITEKIEFKEKNLIYATNIISLILLIFSYIYIDNASYFNLYAENRKVESVYTNLSGRIQALPGYRTNMKILYLGEGDIDIPLSKIGNQITLPHKYSYYNASNILNIHSRRKQMAFYTGFEQAVFEDIDDKLANSIEVKEMQTYPNDGSVKIIDNVIVVKFN